MKMVDSSRCLKKKSSSPRADFTGFMVSFLRAWVIEDKQSLFKSCLLFGVWSFNLLFHLCILVCRHSIYSILQVHLKNPASGTVSPVRAPWFLISFSHTTLYFLKIEKQDCVTVKSWIFLVRRACIGCFGISCDIGCSCGSLFPQWWSGLNGEGRPSSLRTWWPLLFRCSKLQGALCTVEVDVAFSLDESASSFYYTVTSGKEGNDLRIEASNFMQSNTSKSHGQAQSMHVDLSAAFNIAEDSATFWNTQ